MPPPSPPPPPPLLQRTPAALFRKWLGPAICVLISIRVSWYFLQSDVSSLAYQRSHAQRSTQYYFYNEATGQVTDDRSVHVGFASALSPFHAMWCAPPPRVCPHVSMRVS